MFQAVLVESLAKGEAASSEAAYENEPRLALCSVVTVGDDR